MRLARRLRSVWRLLVHREQVDRDLDDEVRGYVEELIEKKIRAGLDPASARRTVLLEIGGVQYVTGEVRSARAGAGIESIAIGRSRATTRGRRSPTCAP